MTSMSIVACTEDGHNPVAGIQPILDEIHPVFCSEEHNAVPTRKAMAKSAKGGRMKLSSGAHDALENVTTTRCKRTLRKQKVMPKPKGKSAPKETVSTVNFLSLSNYSSILIFDFFRKEIGVSIVTDS